MSNSQIKQLRFGDTALVIGLAKSGEAVTKLLLSHGLKVVVNDALDRAKVSHVADELEALGATTVFGEHPLSLLDRAPTFIVKNPGVPYSVPLVAEAVTRGIPIYTEIEVSSWLTESPIYAITGSNGKTTTTTLVGEMLTEAGLRPVVAGNIGVVLSGVVEQVAPTQPIVLEVSSFQLLGTERFCPRIGALLNFYPAHLDYHGTMEAYMEAKWRMFRNQTARDIAVLNYDQRVVRDGASRLSSQLVWFSRLSEVERGVFVRDGSITIRRGGADQALMPLSALGLKGEHHLENALAATAIATWSGASEDAIRHVLTNFRGVEHRLEFVRTVDGVEYYNDSKATNPEAALRALRSFPGRIIWIAGGLDRGDFFSVMQGDIAARVKAAVLLGQSADRVAAVCRSAGVPAVQRVVSLGEAVRTAKRMALPGDVVLLSPACASWDMFSSFEERGRMFKDAVHTL